MTIRTAEVPAADVVPLRWAVLRPGLPRESALFAEDEAPGAFHLAAYTPEGGIGAVISFCAEPLPDAASGTIPAPHTPSPAYRFRGMASAPELRGQGYGAAVLRAGLAAARARGAALAWCNARSEARGFYERHGFTIRGPEFVIETVGPHYVMTATLATAAAPTTAPAPGDPARPVTARP
ncbi:GNAT family N-acetyltransferase [Streptomyces polyrhachis]|uniref:GNAT family N-acetyltransferase n=1 Tax=Streptomyces polyrhachis TaxID=1282885 RepID=A0ABW2GH44_9ACTN